MEDQYGSDFITIVDEDGKEYELEVLSTLEYNGETYMAVIPADAGGEGRRAFSGGEHSQVHRGRRRAPADRH